MKKQKRFSRWDLLPGLCILAVIVAIGSYDLVNDHRNKNLP